MTDQSSNIAKKGKTTRSRSFPYYSIKECISFIQKLNKAEGTKEVHIDVAYKRMGINASSSNAGRALAALTSYALLDERGGGDNKFVWVSSLGKRLLYSEFGSDEWFELVRKAVLNDTVTREIQQKYSNGLPSKESIERYLIVEMNFNERAAIRFSTVLLETFSYARLAEAGGESFEEDFEKISSNGTSRNDQLGGGKSKPQDEFVQPPEKANLQEYRIPLVGGSAFISLPVPISKKNLKLITTWISLMEEALTSTESTEEEEPL